MNAKIDLPDRVYGRRESWPESQSQRKFHYILTAAETSSKVKERRNKQVQKGARSMVEQINRSYLGPLIGNNQLILFYFVSIFLL